MIEVASRLASDSAIAEIEITQYQFSNFGEIIQTAGLTAGYYPHLERNKECKNFLFSPVKSTLPQNISFYVPEEHEEIPDGSNLYAFFESKNLKVIENVHPSILIKAANERVLDSFGIPKTADITLPTYEDELIPVGDGKLGFLNVRRSPGCIKLLNTVKFVDGFDCNNVFLVEKIMK